MFHRVTLRVSDRDASRRFYETILPTLGIDAWPDFAIEQTESHPTTGLHVGFVAPSRTAVDEFWRAGTAAGYQDDGAPGPRPEYSESYYGAFLLDPDGNSAEGVHDGDGRRGGIIDHLWIRVTDLAASTEFYEGVAPEAGFRVAASLPARVRFAGASGSFSILPGPPTRHLRMAFTTSGPAAELIDPDGNVVELVRA